MVFAKMGRIRHIERRGSNHPKNGWLWAHDYSPELVRLYLFVTSIVDWFFWHSVINNYTPAALKNYRCDEARACELLDGLNEMIASESEGSDLLSEESCLLSDLILELYQFPAIELVIRSAAQDNREISDISSSLFTWCTERTAERVVLEDYMKRVINTRSHVFNSGNYHDEMNWLDIYDMEINELYRAWVEEKPRRLEEEIRKKINLFRKHAAFDIDNRAKSQWYAEANYLGIDHKQTIQHWDFFCEYLSLKVRYHKTRVGLIEEAIDSYFSMRQVLRNTDNLIYDFGRAAIDFSESRVQLLGENFPCFGQAL